MPSSSEDPTEVSSDSEAKELTITPVSISSGSHDKGLGIPWETQSAPSLTVMISLIITTGKRCQLMYKPALKALLVNCSSIRNETERTTLKVIVGQGPAYEPQIINKLIKL